MYDNLRKAVEVQVYVIWDQKTDCQGLSISPPPRRAMQYSGYGDCHLNTSRRKEQNMEYFEFLGVLKTSAQAQQQEYLKKQCLSLDELRRQLSLQGAIMDYVNGNISINDAGIRVYMKSITISDGQITFGIQIDFLPNQGAPRITKTFTAERLLNQGFCFNNFAKLKYWAYPCTFAGWDEQVKWEDLLLTPINGYGEGYLLSEVTGISESQFKIDF